MGSRSPPTSSEDRAASLEGRGPLRVVSLAKRALPNVFRFGSSWRRNPDDLNANHKWTDILDGSSFQQPNPLSSIFKRGGLGDFLYHTFLGWHVYIFVLVLIVGACETGLVVLNRLLFMTGVWRFPYPVTTTFAQLLATHLLLVLSSVMTRLFATPLTYLGLSGLVAPSGSLADFSNTSSERILGAVTNTGDSDQGLQSPPRTWPLALVFVLKLMFSNMSFAFTSLSNYTISRIHVVPVSLILSRALIGTFPSISTLSSSLAAVVYLGMASNEPGPPAAWDSRIAAIISGTFVALYPLMFLKIYSDLTPRKGTKAHDGLSHSNSIELEEISTQTPRHPAPSAAAHWHLLRRLSFLSVIFYIPILLVSGEVLDIWRNCYILDQYKLWIPAFGSFLTSFGVFVATPLLVRATSPLTATFIMIPRSAFQLALLHAGMPSACWVGVVSCYISSVWFALVRRAESVTLKRLGN